MGFWPTPLPPTCSKKSSFLPETHIMPYAIQRRQFTTTIIDATIIVVMVVIVMVLVVVMVVIMMVLVVAMVVIVMVLVVKGSSQPDANPGGLCGTH